MGEGISRIAAYRSYLPAEGCHRKMAVDSQTMDFKPRSARSARFVHYAALGCAPSWLHVFVVELLQQRLAGNASILSPRLKSIWSHLIVLIPEDYVGNYSWKCLQHRAAPEIRLLPHLLQIVADHLELENGVEEAYFPGTSKRHLFNDSEGRKHIQQTFVENPKKWKALRLISAPLDTEDFKPVKEHLPWMECIIYTPLVPVTVGRWEVYNTQYREYANDRSVAVASGRGAAHLYLHDEENRSDPTLTVDGLDLLASRRWLRISERTISSKPNPLRLLTSVIAREAFFTDSLQCLELCSLTLDLAVAQDALSHVSPNLMSLKLSSVSLECFADEFLTALVKVRSHWVPCSLTGLVELVTDLPISSLLARWKF